MTESERRRRVDPERRDPVPLLVRERQRDEADQVDDEDEEHQRGDVREPAVDRLRRQPLLGDLGLRDLVDLLAERLRPDRRRARISPTPRIMVRSGTEHQVGDRLRDREVERADVDRDPRVLLELLRRVELALRQRDLRQREREQRHGDERALHRLRPEVRREGQTELKGVREHVDDRRRDRDVRARCGSRDQDREHRDRFEESVRRPALQRRRR